MVLRLPRKFKRRVIASSLGKGEEVGLIGRKGGKIKRQRLEARLIEQELRQYLYR